MGPEGFGARDSGFSASGRPVRSVRRRLAAGQGPARRAAAPLPSTSGPPTGRRWSSAAPAAGAAPKKYESLTSKAAIKSNTRSHENDNNYFRAGADRCSWRGVFGPRADERQRYGARRCDLPRGRRFSALRPASRTGRLNPAATVFTNSASVTVSHNYIRWVSRHCPAWRRIGCRSTPREALDPLYRHGLVGTQRTPPARSSRTPQ